MKAGRKTQGLTQRELDILKILWDAQDEQSSQISATSPAGLFVREIVKRHPKPQPHVNTIATQLKILEEKGHVAHETIGGSHRYYPITQREDVRDRSLRSIISDFFGNSYKSVVSALVAEEKISVEELREIIDMVENTPDSEIK